MHHVLAINQSGIGYSTLAGEPSGGFESQSLGIASEKVAEPIVRAFNRLDGELRRGPSRVSFRFDHPEQGAPFACYGCFFPRTVDQFGREGLVFIHAVELEAASMMPRAAMALFQRLAPPELDRLEREIARIAVATREGDTFLKDWTAAIEEEIRLSTLEFVTSPPDLPGTILHDFHGSSAVACLSILQRQVERPAGWSIQEVRVGSALGTAIEPHEDGVENASALLLRWMGSAVFRPLNEGETALLRSSDATIADLPPEIEAVLGEPTTVQPSLQAAVAATMLERTSPPVPRPPQKTTAKTLAAVTIALAVGLAAGLGLAGLREGSRPVVTPPVTQAIAPQCPPPPTPVPAPTAIRAPTPREPAPRLAPMPAIVPAATAVPTSSPVRRSSNPTRRSTAQSYHREVVPPTATDPPVRPPPNPTSSSPPPVE